MIQYVRLGVCSRCGMQQKILSYHVGAVRPECNCTTIPPTFDDLVAQAYQGFAAMEQEGHDAVLQLAALQGDVSRAYLQSNWDALLEGLVQLTALAKLVGESVLSTEKEAENEPEEQSDEENR